MSVSRYDKFRKRWQGLVLRDHDGTLLYDPPWKTLVSAIITNNDVFLVKQWLEKNPYAQGLGEITDTRPFHTAICHGSIDCLRLMLEYWAASPSTTPTPAPAPAEREYDLLPLACRYARPDVVRLLMDESRPWAARLTRLHERKGPDGTRMESALMAAASSAGASWRCTAEGMRDAEELMCLLLDMGACARDVEYCEKGAYPDADVSQLSATVLTRAMPWASAYIVRRLIDGGADVHAKVIVANPDSDSRYYGPVYCSRDATALHVGSYHFNTEAIQVLLEKGGSEVSAAGMASCRDDNGRTPLHWATGSHGFPGTYPHEHDDDTIDVFTSKAISTVKLLLAANADTINARDVHGDAPLHLAVRRHKEGPGRRPWTYNIIQVLCESGADAGVRDNRGQTPLHHVFSHCDAPLPTEAALAILLMGHGAKVGDVDAGGKTVMHFVAQKLLNVDMVRVLLDNAGCPAEDILRAVDAEGNTPLHIAAGKGDIGGDSQQARMRPVEMTEGRLEDRLREQDAMMMALLPHGRGGGVEGPDKGDSGAGLSLLDIPNAAGQTPRELKEATRRKWRADYEVEQAAEENRREMDKERAAGRR